jgi:hypothetical protein
MFSVTIPSCSFQNSYATTKRLFAVSQECDVLIAWVHVTYSLFKEHFELGLLIGLADALFLRILRPT